MRRAKESLLVLAAGALFAFCLLPPCVQATPQAAGAAAQPPGARDANDGKKNADTSNAARRNKSDPTPRPTPAGTPAEVGADAQAAATPAAGTTPAAQATPEGERGEAGGQEGAKDFTAAARSLFDRWGLTAALIGVALGLVALAVYTVMLRLRLADLGDELEAVKRQLRGGDEVTLPGQTTVRPARASADAARSRGSAAAEPTPEGEGQEQAAETLPAAIPADAMSSLTSRVEEIEKQLQIIAKARATALAEEESRSPDEVNVASVVRPPERVTVDKMVEWAKGAGLRLEPVKATVGLFGKFGRSDDGDNWLAIADGDSYLFPRVGRFESGSHFKSDYLDYYDCDQPSSGTVVIDWPATVLSDPQGGWKLVHKGKLSVVAS